MITRKLVRSTPRQIEIMVDYMFNHQDLANNEWSGLIGRQAIDDKWIHLQSMLKKHGPNKSLLQWQQTWRDLKKRARADYNRAQTDSDISIPKLSGTTTKIISIIGTKEDSYLGQDIIASPALLSLAISPPPASSPAPTIISSSSQDLSPVPSPTEPPSNHIPCPSSTLPEPLRSLRGQPIRSGILRSTSRQIEILVDYMFTHQQFANSVYKGPLVRASHHKEWVHLQSLLREHGPNKSIMQWRITWRDLKKKARAELALLNVTRDQTGDIRTVSRLSSTTTKILSLLGTNVETSLDQDTLSTIHSKSTSPPRISILSSSQDSSHFFVPSPSVPTSPVPSPVESPVTPCPTSTTPDPPWHRRDQRGRSRRLKRCTFRQIEVLVDYMFTHPNFATGHFKSPSGRQVYYKNWVRLQSLLKKYGPNKSALAWRTTWRDLKKKARAEFARLNVDHAQTDNNKAIPNLSETTNKILAIIGIKGYTTGLGENIFTPSTNQPSATTREVVSPSAMSSSSQDLSRYFIPSPCEPASPVPAPSFTFIPCNTSTIPDLEPHRPPSRQQACSRSSIKNEILYADDMETKQSMLKDLRHILRERSTLEEIKARRNHLYSIHRYRMQKHQYMGPTF